MKKILIVIALCLVLVGSMAAPVMAAPRALTFSTFVTNDGVKIPGALPAHFTLMTSGVPGVPAMHILGLIDTKTDSKLTDGNFAFKLQATDAQKTALTAYFTAKGWPAAYLSQITDEINGSKPFFYLNATNGTYTLGDGFTAGLSGGANKSADLRIDDDYPVGMYVYTGTLTSSNASLDVTVTLRVMRADPD